MGCDGRPKRAVAINRYNRRLILGSVDRTVEVTIAENWYNRVFVSNRGSAHGQLPGTL